jgi:hypothetical protein
MVTRSAPGLVDFLEREDLRAGLVAARLLEQLGENVDDVFQGGGVIAAQRGASRAAAALVRERADDRSGGPEDDAGSEQTGSNDAIANAPGE